MGPEESVLVVGTGRAGTGVGLALSRAGINVRFLTSRDDHAIGPLPAFRRTDADCPGNADIALLAVPDRHVPDTAQSLREAEILTGRTFVGQMSGALPSSILDGAGRFAGVFSAHPLFSFPSRNPPVAMPEGTLVMIEAEEGARDRASDLFRMAGASVAFMKPGDKALYHAAAVMCANLPTVLVYEASRLLAGCGVPDPDRASVTLLESVLAHQATAPGPGSVTGPFPRADVETIERNIEALDARDPGLADLYRLLGRRLADLLKASGTLSEGPWRKIRKKLK